MTEEELIQAKNKVLARSVLRSERPMGRLASLGFHWMYRHAYISVEQELEAFNKVTLDDLRRLLADWPLWPLTIVSVGPTTDTPMTTVPHNRNSAHRRVRNRTAPDESGSPGAVGQVSPNRCDRAIARICHLAALTARSGRCASTLIPFLSPSVLTTLLVGRERACSARRNGDPRQHLGHFVFLALRCRQTPAH